MRSSVGPIFALFSTFSFSAGLTFVATTLEPGCQGVCRDQFDCGGQQFCDQPSGRCLTECFTDQDCRSPSECQGNPTACTPRGARCSSVGRCIGTPVEPPEVELGPAADPGALKELEGWDDTAGSGRAFIVDTLAIAERGRGFDVNGACRGPGDCVDNQLWQLGELGNAQIRQGLLGGETLLVVELAGLGEPFEGSDPNLTVKLYGARDADVPFYPSNNFEIPPGDTKCCEFKLDPDSLSPDGLQARARAPARVHRGLLQSLAAVPLEFRLTVGTPPHADVRIDRALIEARVTASLSRLSDGKIGGAIPISSLAGIDNPYCKTLNQLCPQSLPESMLIDLVTLFMQPDIDLDVPRDGLETLELGVDGRVSRCYDGDGLAVPPAPQSGPRWMCALNPRMADGYSVGIRFSATRATILGIGR